MVALLTDSRVLWGWIGLAILVFIVLWCIRAPYGRHQRVGWGPTLPDRIAWVVMELPSLVVMVGAFVAGGRFDEPVLWVFVVMWASHYGHRTLIYPFVRRSRSRPFPIVVMAMGVVFNLVNAGMNGSAVFMADVSQPVRSLADVWLWVGGLLFITGMFINIVSDRMLIRLRRGSDGSYRIPTGFLYRWVSCPNYLGEILEWVGWAIATWSLAGLGFAAWTAANLVPRAWANHQWYREQFADYPAERRAVIPFVL